MANLLLVVKHCGECPKHRKVSTPQAGCATDYQCTLLENRVTQAYIEYPSELTEPPADCPLRIESSLPKFLHDCAACTFLFNFKGKPGPVAPDCPDGLDIYKQCGKDNGFTARFGSQGYEYLTVPLPHHIAGDPQENLERNQEYYPWYKKAMEMAED